MGESTFKSFHVLNISCSALIKMLFKGLQYISNPSTIVSKIMEKTIGKAASRIEEVVSATVKKIGRILKKGAKGAKEMEEH